MKTILTLSCLLLSVSTFAKTQCPNNTELALDCTPLEADSNAPYVMRLYDSINICETNRNTIVLFNRGIGTETLNAEKRIRNSYTNYTTKTDYDSNILTVNHNLSGKLSNASLKYQIHSSVIGFAEYHCEESSK